MSPTTAYGLYRYHIHDLVQVTGFHNGTPLIEFLSKGSHFANITGENHASLIRLGASSGFILPFKIINKTIVSVY